MTNILYYGENLDVLRRYIKQESIDLIYLSPSSTHHPKIQILTVDDSLAGKKVDMPAVDQQAATF